MKMALGLHTTNLYWSTWLRYTHKNKKEFLNFQLMFSELFYTNMTL